jgi:hypothetical protein
MLKSIVVRARVLIFEQFIDGVFGLLSTNFAAPDRTERTGYSHRDNLRHRFSLERNLRIQGKLLPKK